MGAHARIHQPQRLLGAVAHLLVRESRYQGVAAADTGLQIGTVTSQAITG